ncbi:MAG: Na+:solute symporter [Bacteroidales bacterium]|jgi:Na+/proline symporter|nr:Na+:solute symporter [Bacteroidales bacterium]HOI31949.1 Na+:solute symporter [Bacteroidales bacterium]
MNLNTLDWIIVGVFFVLLISIGIWASRNAGRGYNEFFLSGRNMPWWLLGVSMVATTFSCDTPNLVTDIVRQKGVGGNWLWWAFLFTGMLTVFVYAKLWNRSKVLTDLEFYEIRYSGKMAAFLRGFRAIYLGAFFNIMVIASVSIALIKISGVMLGWSAGQTLIIAAVIVVFYSALGGLKSILYSDFFQFSLAMAGAIGAAIILVNKETGDLATLFSHPAVAPQLNLIPDINNTEMFVSLLIIPLAVQWWSVWYPGAEPGGGGYIAQRMLSAKDEKNAIGATLLFNFFHYAMRPWPWIIVGLLSLIVFPDLASLQQAFPNIDPQYVQHDLAYPAMLKRLPNGFLGLVVASLIAAFMSTTASHLNWGSSYIVNDFYVRFLKPEATQQQQVIAGRITTAVLMFFAVLLALMLQNALQAFHILLQIGAGTGLIYILRWFWWRINAYTELTGMLVSFIVALGFLAAERFWGYNPGETFKILAGVGITTISWLIVTYLTPPADKEILRAFYKRIRPGGPGWKKIVVDAENEGISLEKSKGLKWDVPTGILAMIWGVLFVYSTLFAIGELLYAKYLTSIFLIIIGLVSLWLLTKTWKKLRLE